MSFNQRSKEQLCLVVKTVILWLQVVQGKHVGQVKYDTTDGSCFSLYDVKAIRGAESSAKDGHIN